MKLIAVAIELVVRLLLSLSLSAISWQVSGLIRKITENKKQRKRPINQERIERGAINIKHSYFLLFFFLSFLLLVLMVGFFINGSCLHLNSKGLESFDDNKLFLLK